MKKIILVIIAMCAFSIISSAQDVTGTVIAGSSPVVKNAPYSADSITETVQTLLDGNKITNSFKYKVYRDGEGRTRREQLPSTSLSASFLNLRETITIIDPVAGFNYYLNPVTKTARRLPITPRPTVTGTPASGSMGYSTTSESQGVKTIEGIECTGRISKTVIAPQTVGNEKEIVMTFESCFSNELKTSILSINNDPRTGISTNKLVNISRTEPDKSLFTIPEDYKVINQ